VEGISKKPQNEQKPVRINLKQVSNRNKSKHTDGRCARVQHEYEIIKNSVSARTVSTMFKYTRRLYAHVTCTSCGTSELTEEDLTGLSRRSRCLPLALALARRVVSRGLVLLQYKNLASHRVACPARMPFSFRSHVLLRIHHIDSREPMILFKLHLESRSLVVFHLTPLQQGLRTRWLRSLSWRNRRGHIRPSSLL